MQIGPSVVPVGAIASQSTVTFRVWAPKFKRVDVNLNDGESILPLNAVDGGYFEKTYPGIRLLSTYNYILDDRLSLPDPASRCQPNGVHAPSVLVDCGFPWTDSGWKGINLDELIIYELHVGTFSEEGTFEGVTRRLQYLSELGITAIELMPVGDFSGARNWGYDTAYLFAPSRNYGTPADLRRLINEAHRMKIAVILDVVYNHFGPDGCYAPAYGEFFTRKHTSTWGQGINLDDENSEGVRNFFKYNALYWLEDFHFDGLRLDATHALQDSSQTHFLAELSSLAHAIPGPRRFLIAEDERNFSTIIRPSSENGYALDAVWADDFHHQIRNLSTGDNDSYYQDFTDTSLQDVAATIEKGWYYTGQYSKANNAARGSDPAGVSLEKFVICIQNHDQVGNRAFGERLNHEIDRELYHALSTLLLLAPETPLLFMGQEFAASSPFQFFTDHNDELGAKITEGRRKEFEGFKTFRGNVPDPQDNNTFLQSKLNWNDLANLNHLQTLNLYRRVIELRRIMPKHTEVTAVNGNALQLIKGPYCILVAIREVHDNPLNERYSILFHTEQEEYAVNPRQPLRTKNSVSFERPGALVAEWK